MNKLAILTGLTGFAAVALGAFGAHALKPHLDAVQTDTYRTAVNYHLVHAVAMLVLLVGGGEANKVLRISFYLFFAGVICFSGSLYLLATRHLTLADGLAFLGPVTPLGGVLMIAGWLNLVRMKTS